jgi:DNA-binding transcriptional LysR family regulator
LNFSRAAEDLGTAQPSLSQQIRHLESEIGVALFDRAKRRIALTGAGLDFLGEARALVAGLDGAVARARETARGLRGELRIAYTISAMVSTLPSAIREYRTSHPDVRITLRSMDTTSLIAALETREVDAGVFVTQGDLRRFEGITARRIGSLPMAVVLPASHRLATRRSIAIGDLGDEALITYARARTEIHDIVIGICRERGFEPARIEEVDRMETLLGLVAAAEGFSIVPRIYDVRRAFTGTETARDHRRRQSRRAFEARRRFRGAVRLGGVPQPDHRYHEKRGRDAERKPDDETERHVRPVVASGVPQQHGSRRGNRRHRRRDHREPPTGRQWGPAAIAHAATIREPDPMSVSPMARLVVVVSLATDGDVRTDR